LARKRIRKERMNEYLDSDPTVAAYVEK